MPGEQLATGGVDPIVVERVVDATEDEVIDELTEFALRNGLEVRRQHSGDGLLFVRKSDAPVEGKELFRSGDELLVRMTPGTANTHLALTAVMRGLHRRGDEWKQGRLIRGGIFSALFFGLGIAGLSHGVNPGDFVLLGLGALSGTRAINGVRNESSDRESFEHEVANRLHELCDQLNA